MTNKNNTPSASFVTWLHLPPRNLLQNASLRFRHVYVRQYRQHAAEQCALIFGGTMRWEVRTVTTLLKKERKIIVPVRVGFDPPKWFTATVQFTFVLPFAVRNRRRDIHNLDDAMKSAIDGLVTAGLLADDDQLTHRPSSIKYDEGEDFGAVRVEVWKGDA